MKLLQLVQQEVSMVPMDHVQGKLPVSTTPETFYWHCSINSPAWIKGELWLICCGVGQQESKKTVLNCIWKLLQTLQG